MKRIFPLVALLVLILPARLAAVVVVLLSSGNTAFDTQAAAVLQAGGHTVSIGLPYASFTGAELAGADAVVMLPNYNWSSGDMSLAAQTALRSFVSNGGGLVTSEWTIWKTASGNFSTLSDVFPVVATSNYTSASSLTYTQATPNAVLNAGLPEVLTFATDNIGGTETYFAPKANAVVYYTSSGGTNLAGVIGGTYGAGQVLQFSSVVGSTQLGDSQFAQLFQNSVSFVAVPEPSTLALLGVGIAVVAWSIRRRRT